MMRGEPFLQRDLVHVMEHKAIIRPPSQPQSASARPSLRPRSANASQEPARPQTGEDGHRRLHASHMGARADQRGGYTFSTGSSPRPEALARSSCRQPLSALQASQRKRLGAVEPPSIADLLPAVSGLPFQPNVSGWFQTDGMPPQTPLWDSHKIEDEVHPPPPQRPPSASTDANATECCGCCCGCGSYADGASRPRSSSVSRDVLSQPPASPAAQADARTMSPERERARETARRNGLPDLASVEAVSDAVDERTAILTKIFQERLAKQRGALEAIRESEKRAHESEVRQLKSAFEERLTEAVEKVRAVHATNRDAVAILHKNKKLRNEVATLKHEMSAAVEAQRDSAARERQRAEEGAAVVQQLMSQLQEKEALLAAGAGAMSEEEREEMMRKERQRAQQAADKEKKRIEAAMSEERNKAMERLTALQNEVVATKRLLAESHEEATAAKRALDKERRAHMKTSEAKDALEVAWKAEESKRERLAKLEISVNVATKQISTALLSMREFHEATNAHLKVDLECLVCLQPLIDPQVLVPCGHSICLKCSQALDQAGYGGKVCPLCVQLRAEAASYGSSRYGSDYDEMEEAPSVEHFPNQMLDGAAFPLECAPTASRRAPRPGDIKPHDVLCTNRCRVPHVVSRACIRSRNDSAESQVARRARFAQLRSLHLRPRQYSVATIRPAALPACAARRGRTKCRRQANQISCSGKSSAPLHLGVTLGVPSAPPGGPDE